MDEEIEEIEIKELSENINALQLFLRDYDVDVSIFNDNRGVTQNNIYLHLI